jgi:hypothetical protein
MTKTHPKRQAILEEVEIQELEEVLLADGHDDAILGLVDVGEGRIVVAYSTKMILQGLVNEGLTWDEASEHFEFNIRGAYCGPGTPVYVQDDFGPFF